MSKDKDFSDENPSALINEKKANPPQSSAEENVAKLENTEDSKSGAENALQHNSPDKSPVVNTEKLEQSSESSGISAIFVPPFSVGSALRSAREAKKISAQEAARTLKLSTHQIEQMENNEWEKLPCSTILRGFVRNYARLLGISSVPLMQELDRLEPAKHALELKEPSRDSVDVPERDKKINRRDSVRVAMGILILLLAFASYFLLPSGWFTATSNYVRQLPLIESLLTEANDLENTQNGEEKIKEDAPFNAPSDTKKEDKITEAPTPEKTAESLPNEASSPLNASASQISSSADNAKTTNLAPPTQNPTLKFSFKQGSWVEVKNKNGEIIASQMNQPGTSFDIAGTPPFSLVIGNAGNVVLEYKGKIIDLSRRSKDDVARLSLE